MIFEERKKLILQQLKEHSTVTIQVLKDETKASTSTLRRDLQNMGEEGLLSRTHGGATLRQGVLPEQNVQEKIALNLEAKTSLAQYAAQLVKADSQIYVDAGTTTLALIKALPIDKNIQIVTNGVDHALIALQRNLPVTIIGGPVKPYTHAIAGITAYQQLQKFNFETAFIGMNGLTSSKGLTTTNIDEATLKEVAMAQCQRVYILVDSSKLDQVYEFKVEAPKWATILIEQDPVLSDSQTLKELYNQYNIHIIKEEDK